MKTAHDSRFRIQTWIVIKVHMLINSILYQFLYVIMALNYVVKRLTRDILNKGYNIQQKKMNTHKKPD